MAIERGDLGVLALLVRCKLETPALAARTTTRATILHPLLEELPHGRQVVGKLLPILVALLRFGIAFAGLPMVVARPTLQLVAPIAGDLETQRALF